MWTYFFGILTFITSLFLILLILIQRGRGGGLAGALGGMGGQSAFGTKAGDLFTRVTIGVAAFWIVLSIFAIKVLNNSQDSVFGTGGSAASSTFGGSAKDQKAFDPKATDTTGSADSKTEPGLTSGAPSSDASQAASSTSTAPATPAAPSTSAPPAAPSASAPTSTPSAAPSDAKKE